MDKTLVTTEQWYKDHAKTGVERITQEDLPMPMLQLVQRTSNLQLPDGSAPQFGKFYYTATKTQFETFPCYILGAHTEMRPTFKDKEKMEKVYVFIGVDATFQMPFKMIFRSTQVPVAKNFLGSVFATKKPIFAVKVILTSKTIDGSKGVYAITVVTEKGVEDNMEKLTMLEKLSEKYAAPMTGEIAEEIVEEVDAPVKLAAEVEGAEEVDSSDIPF
jgi:hypothetical protein